MNLRMAEMKDLQAIRAMYRRMISEMDKAGIRIWDDHYPCEAFEEDIRKERLYILMRGEEILSAFALNTAHYGIDTLQWKAPDAKAMYIDRLGVDPALQKQGIGALTLKKAVALAKKFGAQYLRLFVVSFNEPAIRLYEKAGFQKAGGIYDLVIDKDTVLQEFGFEIEI